MTTTEIRFRTKPKTVTTIFLDPPVVYSEEENAQRVFKKAFETRFPLEVSNSTVYNSEDIRKLWLFAHKIACQIKLDEGRNWPAADPPDKLQISYYTRTSDAKAVKQEDRKKKGGVRRSSYGNIRYTGSKYKTTGYTPVKLGIVRPSKLYSSPLQQMAAVAEDVMYLPRAEVIQICNVLKDHYGIWGTSNEKEWSILHDMQIRYGDRAKRGSRQGASKLAKKDRIYSLRQRSQKCDDAIRFAKKMIKENTDKKQELLATYNKVADSLNIPEYERWI